MSTSRLRVLVLRDAALFANSASSLLLASPAFETIARTTDVVRAIGIEPNPDTRRSEAIVAAHEVDIVLVALSDELARIDDSAMTFGIEAFASAGVPVVLMLGFGDESTSDFARSLEWLKRHVRGVLSIDTSSAELSAALSAVGAGLVIMEPRIADALILNLQLARRRAGSEPPSSRAAGSSLPLSAREREVLALLAEGRATKNIAHMLGISSHTVKAHVESIFEKFGATTRAEAVAIGVRRGAVML